MRAKTIDRLAMTREKFEGKLKYGEEFLTASKSRPLAEHREGYSICPNCGQETLIHEDGCKHCRSCGWSACG